MGILAQAKSDIQDITTNSDSGWGVTINFISPLGILATVTGLHKKHHLGIDTDGNQVNAKHAAISFSEQVLVSTGYPVRSVINGEVDLKGHKVTVIDSTGIQWEYVIREWFPDETIGLIVCILGDFE